jgi:hypothetical protein
VQSGIKSQSKGIKGAISRLLARNVETVLSIPGKKLYKKYVKATHDVEATQNAVLNEILDYAGETEFGRQHGFGDIGTYAKYRERVPVHDYEALRPMVDRHCKGEENVLFPGKPLMYNRSSGTTALSKLIPVTPYQFERTIKNRGKLWLYGLMRHYPGIYSGKDLVLVSSPVEGHTEDGTPYGSLSGLIYQNIPDFVKLIHSIPYEGMMIKDYDAKAYSVMRFGMPQDISSIFTGNPATVLNLVSKADLWKERLIRDVRDGTLDQDIDIEPETRSVLEQMLEPAPERAAELEGYASRNDQLRPADYWPNLKLVHTWKNGNTGLLIPKLMPWFRPGTPSLDFGYIASEITATDLMDPETDGSLLQVQNAFYEFVPVEEEDLDDADKTWLLTHQLEKGRKYYIYVTTFSGLYRYDMNDVIEVVGHFNQVPIIIFLYKGKGITNLQGEKLSEAQFIEALGQAGKETGIGYEFFFGFADKDISGYKLYIEFHEDQPKEALLKFGREVDKQLCAVNIEYEGKFATDRIKRIQVIDVGKQAFQRYRAIRLAEGAHEGQLKWLNLSSTDADKARLQKLAEQAK